MFLHSADRSSTTHSSFGGIAYTLYDKLRLGRKEQMTVLAVYRRGPNKNCTLKMVRTLF